MFETILVDGTDLAIPGTRLVRVWKGVLVTPSLRGDDLEIPDADGATDMDERPFDPFNLGLDLTVRGGDNATFNDRYRALRRLVKVDGTVTLTRRLSFSSGNEEHTTRARYLSGLEPDLFGMIEADIPLVMKVLDGLWWGPTTTIGAGSVTVLGDVRTRRMTITFTGGTNPRLTNTTTGDWVQWNGAVGGSTVVVDVEELTAIHGTHDSSGVLEWARTFPMTLQAGVNSLSVSGGGSVSIAYAPAYL